MIRTTKAGRSGLLAAALAALAACGDGGGAEVPPDVLAARQDAARNACIAAEILNSARDDVLSVTSTLAPEGTVQRMAADAALVFARAYEHHAELRVGAYAQLDSALNHSPSPADSLRYLQTAQSFTLRPPEPESVEMNVIQAYERDFVAFRADADHPCNWDLPQG